MAVKHKNLLYSTMLHVSLYTTVFRRKCTRFKNKWNALKYIGLCEIR